MKKQKIIEKKKTQMPTLIDATFLDRTGKVVKLSKYISEKDCWLLKRDTSQWVLSHYAIKKIAQVAGISKNYDVEESSNIIPSIQNDFEHIIRVTIHCNSKAPGKAKKGECAHSDENTLTITGEANRINTPNRGKGYLRKMAEKRAYDIAVLEHLGLYTSIFSEEESEEFQQPTKERKEVSIMPGTKEFDMIISEINILLDSKTKVELKIAVDTIKKNIKANNYSDTQIQYLRELYHKKFAEFNKTF